MIANFELISYFWGLSVCCVNPIIDFINDRVSYIFSKPSLRCCVHYYGYLLFIVSNTQKERSAKL